MPSFGFRVFEVELREASRGRNPLLWEQPLRGEPHHLQTLENLTRDHLLDQTVFCVPVMDRPFEDPDEARQGDPILLVSTMRTAPGRLSLAVKYGFKGEFDSGVPERGEEVDLTEMAAAKTYRVELFAPREGIHGYLAVETIGIRCPVAMVVNWWGRAAYEHGAFIKVNATPAIDGDRIKEILDDSQRVEIELAARGRTRDGGRQAKKTKLLHEVTNEARRNDLFGVLFNASVNREGIDVATVEEIAGFQPELLEAANLRFETAAIAVSHENGTHRKIVRPEKLRTMFTYPISYELQPQADVWERAVTERVGRLSADQGTFWG